MGARIVVDVAPHLYREQLRPVAAIKLLEAVHGHAGGARHELQQPRTHLVVEGEDNLKFNILIDVKEIVFILRDKP